MERKRLVLAVRSRVANVALRFFADLRVRLHDRRERKLQHIDGSRNGGWVHSPRGFARDDRQHERRHLNIEGPQQTLATERPGLHFASDHGAGRLLHQDERRVQGSSFRHDAPLNAGRPAVVVAPSERDHVHRLRCNA